MFATRFNLIKQSKTKNRQKEEGKGGTAMKIDKKKRAISKCSLYFDIALNY